jgi:hypothetical protein
VRLVKDSLLPLSALAGQHLLRLTQLNQLSLPTDLPYLQTLLHPLFHHELRYPRPFRITFPNPTSESPIDEFGQRTSCGCMKGPFRTGILANGSQLILSLPPA